MADRECNLCSLVERIERAARDGDALTIKARIITQAHKESRLEVDIQGPRGKIGLYHLPRRCAC